jgi:hypothetical protein
MPVGALGTGVRLVELVELCDQGAGIALLERLAHDDSRLSTEVAVLAEQPHVGVCGGGGSTALLCGPPAVDWAAALASKHSPGLVLIRDVVDVELACALAVFGASRATTVVVAAAPAAAHRAWCAYAGADGGAIVEELVPEPWIAEHGAPLLNAHAPSPRTPWLLIGSGQEAERPAAHAVAGVRGVRELGPLRQRAYAHGVHVNVDTWHELTACADRILVPTSPTSRLGAG